MLAAAEPDKAESVPPLLAVVLTAVLAGLVPAPSGTVPEVPATPAE